MIRFGLFSVFFVVITLMILAVGLFVFIVVLRRMNSSPQAGGIGQNPTQADPKRRAIDIVSQQRPNAPAYKCGKCAATVDSTAEVSADGRIRCNYCNEWTSIL